MSAPNPPSASLSDSVLHVALIGNPNTGKSTLFNALTGGNARIGNFPGVTVEKKLGKLVHQGKTIQLVDLPGTYSLAPRSADEMVSVDVLLGRVPEIGRLDAVICIVDATNLERNLYLFSQIRDLNLPTLLVLNMWDSVKSSGIDIQVEQLSARLGVPIVTTSAHRREGIDDVRNALLMTIQNGPSAPIRLFPEAFYREVEQLGEWVQAHGGKDLPEFLCERILLDVHGEAEHRGALQLGDEFSNVLQQARGRLAEAGCRVPLIETKVRYQWIREQLEGVFHRPQVARQETLTDRIDRWVTHKVTGTLLFLAVMFVIFQSIFIWADPMMGWVEDRQDDVAGLVSNVVPPGTLQSLLVDGVVAGVGSVLVFLPQIVLLFLFVAILEDCGYMARAAFLMDKLMTKVGLSGKSFLPLMSSFACAIPGVMATRVIENRKDRMVTMLIAPLMSCSARIPVYVLMITAFVPAWAWAGGWIRLQGLVMMAMYSVGVLVAIPVAWILKKTLFKGETPPFVMELPPYKWPSLRVVADRVFERAKAFVTEAGTLIFAVTLIVWALGYFPGSHTEQLQLQAQIEQENEKLQQAIEPIQIELAELQKQLGDGTAADRSEQIQTSMAELQARQMKIEEEAAAVIEPLEERERHVSSELTRNSYLGRMGRGVEPLFRPLGWDWRLAVGAIASFPAREVIIATLGTIFSLGGEVDEESSDLISALQSATWPDGAPLVTLPVALSIMVFFALCAQCGATLMVIRRETNSWRWPIFTFVYLTILAYIGALLTYQIGSLLI